MMTQEEFKMAVSIARIAGWRMQERLSRKLGEDFPDWYRGPGVYTPENEMASFYGRYGDSFVQLGWEDCFNRGLIPEYPKDLNALNKLLRTKNLTPPGSPSRTGYWLNLVAICGSTENTAFATARQHAEAILMTFPDKT